jgi:hypothetical protein
MLRTTQLAQLQLSAMADTKASILMGATFVIFTITIGQARQGGAPIAFFAAIFAILAVLPMTRARKKTQSTPNILFFGVFSHMAEDDFIEEVVARLATDDSVYRTMAHDIHQNGMVLQHKKYRMLGIAYRIFLAGLVASCAAYVILFLI